MANWMQFSAETPLTIATSYSGSEISAQAKRAWAPGSSISARAGQTLKLKYTVSEGETVC